MDTQRLEYTSLKKDASTANNHAEHLVKMEKYIDQVEELLKRYEEQPKLTELFERYKGQLVEGTLIRHKVDLVQLMANQTMVEVSKETEETDTEVLLPTVRLKAVAPTPKTPAPLSTGPFTLPGVSGGLQGHWILLIGLCALTGAALIWCWRAIMKKRPEKSEQSAAFKENVSTGVRPFGRQS